MKTVTLITGLLLLVLVQAWASAKDKTGLAETTRITTENFKTRGMDATGKRQWDMVGAKALVDGTLANLETITFTFFLDNGDPIVVTSPACVYNSMTQIGSSTAPIHITHQQMTIDGKGYDIVTAERRIHIRADVNMIIHQQEAAAPGLKSLLQPSRRNNVNTTAGDKTTPATDTPSTVSPMHTEKP